MLGTNKTVSVERLNGYKTAYVNICKRLDVRWSAMKYQSEEGYGIKAKQITFKMLSELKEFLPGDRVFWCNPDTREEESYVIIGKGMNTDSLGTPTTCLVRQLLSPMHEDIIWWIPDATQPNYDPLLEEYVKQGQKMNNTVIKALIDPIDSAKATYIKFIEAGKLEDIDFVLTADFPDVVTSKHKFTYLDSIYEVKWILPQEWQTLIGLKKSVISYVKQSL